MRSDTTREPATSDAERATVALGQNRAARLECARAALSKRFASQPAGADATQWQDPQALYWHRRLTTIVEAACCLPAHRSEFGQESDSDLRQLADEALTGARAAYSAPRAGSAHHAVRQACR